ncbi:MAG: peptidoglycan DD-metalloendopeptidase family protein [Pseudomonadota bacterium]
MRVFLVLLMLSFGAPVGAQQNPVAQAETALADLRAASISLQEVEKARDRVRALTATIQAFENGLGALREGMRRTAIREKVLSERLNGQRAEIANLLATLQGMARAGSPEVLLHPSGATGTARAGMLLAGLSPRLNARAQKVRNDLQEIQTLRAVQVASTNQMQNGLQQIQRARAALNQAMADRKDLPARFTTDPTRTALLIASAETLDGFASGLGQMIEDEIAPPLDLGPNPGEIALPVRGVVLRKAGEADMAGVVRPGVVLATRPNALVTSPTAATIRYIGPLLDMGRVVILEPQARTLFVIAGLGDAYGTAGQVIEAGTPIGTMGPLRIGTDELMSPIGEGTGTDRSETLYIEVRENNRPVDPATWFATGPDT